MRRLRGFARAEDSCFRSVDRCAQQPGQGPDGADLAQQMGDADRAHLCRETRRHAGFTPAELRDGVLDDASFWPYRVWTGAGSGWASGWAPGGAPGSGRSRGTAAR